jgi:hypothetical protein
LLLFSLASLLVISAPLILTLLLRLALLFGALLLLSLSLLRFGLAALLVVCAALILTRLLLLPLLLVIPPTALFLPLLIAPTALRISQTAGAKQHQRAKHKK